MLLTETSCCLLRFSHPPTDPQIPYFPLTPTILTALSPPLPSLPQSGFLFSANALNASSLSPPPKQTSYSLFSTSSLPPLTARNAHPTALGPPSQIPFATRTASSNTSLLASPIPAPASTSTTRLHSPIVPASRPPIRRPVNIMSMALASPIKFLRR